MHTHTHRGMCYNYKEKTHALSFTGKMHALSLCVCVFFRFLIFTVFHYILVRYLWVGRGGKERKGINENIHSVS